MTVSDAKTRLRTKRELGTLVALCACFTAAVTSAFIVPVIAGSLVEGFGLSESSIGYVLSAELGAMAIGSLVVVPWLLRIRAREAASLALAAIVLGNILCTLVDGIVPLLAIRTATGLVEGVLQAVVISLAARTCNPHSTFSVIYTAVASLTMLLFLLLPALQGVWGPRAPFYLMAVFVALALPTAVMLPSRGGAIAAGPGPAPGSAAIWTFGGLSLLIGWALFQLGQNGMWSYAERIAVHIQIDYRQMNFIFAISSVTTILATLAAGWCGQRVGLLLPIAAATLASAAAIFAYPFAPDALAFTAATIVFSAALFFAQPFVGTLAAEIDPTGRLAGALPASQAIGMTLGPAAAALALQGFHSFVWVGIVNAGATLGALILLVFQAASADRARISVPLRGVENA